MKSFATLAVCALAFVAQYNPAQAKDCSVAIYKTYLPRAPGRPSCDSKNLPAEFAGDISTFSRGLSALGFSAKTFNQCAGGEDKTTAYSLISQLGDCVQTGAFMSCKLYVALYNNESGNAVFENTVSGVGFGGVKLHLSEAVSSLPECAKL